jgi:hypothetical protein
MIKQVDDPVIKRVKDVIEHGAFAIGQQQFINLCYGDRLQTLELIKAYCYDCMGYYEDGITDCENVKCPLYSKMPYGYVVPRLARTERDKHVVRNPQYPMDKRMKTIKSNIGVDTDATNKGIVRSLVSRKLKSRKYPQEITQKEMLRDKL